MTPDELIATIAALNAALAQKDAALAETNAALTEKDAALAEKDAALAVTNAALATLKIENDCFKLNLEPSETELLETSGFTTPRGRSHLTKFGDIFQPGKFYVEMKSAFIYFFLNNS